MAIRAPFTQHRRAVPDCSYLHTVQLQSSACSRTHNLSVCTPPLTIYPRSRAARPTSTYRR